MENKQLMLDAKLEEYHCPPYAEVRWRLTNHGIETKNQYEHVVKLCEPSAVDIAISHYNAYKNFIAKYSTFFVVPAELILATMVTEDEWRDDKRIGLMGIRVEKANWLRRYFLSTKWAEENEIPEEINSNRLLFTDDNVLFGTALIVSQRYITGYDPVKVAIVYREEKLKETIKNGENRWGYVCNENHVNDWIAIFNEIYELVSVSQISSMGLFYKDFKFSNHNLLD